MVTLSPRLTAPIPCDNLETAHTSRAALAAAVRPIAPGGRLLAAHMPSFHAFGDALGLPRITPGAPGTVIIELTAQDFADAARMLGCSVAQIRAVFEVDAQGAGWFTDVRGSILELDGPGGFLDGPHLPKILSEAHVFDREAKGRYRDTHPDTSSAAWNRALYIGGEGEYERLHRAMALDRRAALRSASWGAAQIMGFNQKAGWVRHGRGLR
jgi:N-acetylmuramidase